MSDVAEPSALSVAAEWNESRPGEATESSLRSARALGLAAVKVELREMLPREGDKMTLGRFASEMSRPQFREQSWLAAQSEDRVDDLADRIKSRLPKSFAIERSPVAWTERGSRAMTRLGCPSAVFRVVWDHSGRPDEGWEEGNLDLEAALSRAIREGFKESVDDRPSYRVLGDRLADRQQRAGGFQDREASLWPEIVAGREAWLLDRMMERPLEEKRRSL